MTKKSNDVSAMRSPKVLLVQPNYQRAQSASNKIDNIVGVHPPLGLLYIAGSLISQEIETQIFDANCHRSTPEDVLGVAADYDVVGVSVLNQGHRFAVTLAEKLPPGILKICGGPHAAGYVEEMLGAGFDIVARGEGESVMAKICAGDALETIPGISWRDNGRVIHNENAAALDVNQLPLPARDLLVHSGTRWPYASAGTRMFPWAPILTSRGCPFTCYYCNKTIHGLRFRPRTAEDVVSEIVALVHRCGVREIDILDDIFNLDIDRAMRICDLIIENNLKISLRFGNGIRADRIPPELALKLKKAGTTYVAFGLESGCQKILDHIPKKIKLDQVRRGVGQIRKVGIHTTGLFMLGLLQDTEASMKKTIAFAKELKLDIAYFSIATPYPGTRFYNMVKERGKLLVEDWESFNHSYGKLLYTYPGAPSPELVQAMFRQAYREFYLRPEYIFRQLIRRRSLNEWRVMARGGKDLLRNLFLRGRD